MLDDIAVIFITLLVSLFIIFYQIFDLYAHRRAFNSVREIIFRVLIPLILSIAYLIPYFIYGWNTFALLIFLQMGLSMLLAVVLWESEAFLGMTLDLEKIGRVNLFLYFYFEPDQKIEVNLYKWTEESMTLETLVTLIDGFGIFNRERQQFESDEKWNEYVEAKDTYDVWKADAEHYRIDVYSYYDFTDRPDSKIRWRGFKKAFHINKLDIIGKKIEGNAVFLPEKIKINHRTFEQLVIWEGFKDRMICQELEITKMILISISYLSQLEEIPLLRNEIKHKDQLLEMQRDTIQNMEDDVYLAQIKTPTGDISKAQSQSNQWFQRLFILIFFMLIAFISVVLLLGFGII